jgi:hypothetical protein
MAQRTVSSIQCFLLVDLYSFSLTFFSFSDLVPEGYKQSVLETLSHNKKLYALSVIKSFLIIVIISDFAVSTENIQVTHWLFLLFLLTNINIGWRMKKMNDPWKTALSWSAGNLYTQTKKAKNSPSLTRDSKRQKVQSTYKLIDSITNDWSRTLPTSDSTILQRQ